MSYINNFQTLLLSILISIVITSCLSTDSEFSDYFETLKTQVDHNLLEQIKKCPEDKLNRLISRSQNQFLSLLSKDKGLNNILSENLINRDIDKMYILLKATHRRLNNREDKVLELIGEINTYTVDTKEWRQKIENCDSLSQQIATQNYSSHSIGDTIEIILPYNERSNSKNAFFYNCPTDYEKNDDYEVLIVGILEEMYTNKQDTLGKYFDIKIISMDVENISVLMEKLSPGDILTLPLKSYGREILTK